MRNTRCQPSRLAKLRRRYFQPDSLSQALRSATWVFSHWVMDWVSLSLILLFMQVQYFRITASAAAPLLSFTHALIHLTSSVVAAKAAAVVTQTAASARTAAIVFMARLPDGRLVDC